MENTAHDFTRIPTYIDLTKIKTIDNGEPLVNISELLSEKCVCKHEQTDMLPYTGTDIYVRESLVGKISKIADEIIKYNPNWKLKIVYGFRHPDVQLKYFETEYNLAKQKFPNYSDSEIKTYVHNMIAVPEVAGHPTGGALDLTIVDEAGEIEMGSQILDSNFEGSEEIILTNSKLISKQEKINRMLLHDFMIKEEFAPFYGEYWHFSYGDREWAWFYNKPNAIYEEVNFKAS